MSNYAIKVEGLGKRYRIGARQQYKALRDVLTDALRAPARAVGSLFRGPDGRGPGPESHIWALKDVSFQVGHGEVLGIIGRNGAGKSTLLKILSRITEPTEGEVRLRGRVGSLLEVGTGFHPELTGRENVYLNGAILGMRRTEIERKFDEIVAFAEIEKFLDTPVKHFSSGMYVRLAFAVAAHLEPEILLVDEVLAVGDAAFQKKCLGKMGDVASEGRTVLFVSHNLAAIDNLCRKAFWIDHGQLLHSGPSAETISMYHGAITGSQSALPTGILYVGPCRPGTRCSLTRLEILGASRTPLAMARTGDTVVFRLHYYCEKKMSSGAFTIDIAIATGIRILRLSSSPLGCVPLELPEGSGYVDCVIPWLPLAAGIYRVGVGIAIPNREWVMEVTDVAELNVSEGDVYHSGLAPRYPKTSIAVEHSWVHVHLDSGSSL